MALFTPCEKAQLPAGQEAGWAPQSADAVANRTISIPLRNLTATRRHAARTLSLLMFLHGMKTQHFKRYVRRFVNRNTQMSTAANAVPKKKKKRDIPRFPLGSSILLWRAVALLVEALRYKPEGRGFDSQWGHRDFSST